MRKNFPTLRCEVMKAQLQELQNMGTQLAGIGLMSCSELKETLEVKMVIIHFEEQNKVGVNTLRKRKLLFLYNII